MKRPDTPATAWRRVLIVDDDRDTREMYCEYLRAVGFDAVGASSARDALALTAHFLPAVIVTDLRLDGGMDGFELARTVKEDARTRDARIVLLSGATVSSDRQHAEQLHCDLFLTKPCLPDDLAGAIRRLVVKTLKPGTHGSGNLRAPPGKGSNTPSRRKV